MSASVFDQVAQSYDRYRPGYPVQLYSDLIELVGLTSRSKVLEVGVGTGKATRGFAERGIPVLGLEPGPAMAAQARVKFEAFSHIEIATETFESFEVESGALDLVYSAQAFHWVAPEVRFVKASQILKENGYLAIFANVPRRLETELGKAMDDCYRSCAPSHRATGAERRDAMESAFLASPLFKTLPIRRYSWLATYPADDYVALLMTYSDHYTLPEAERSALCDGIRSVISEHGGSLQLAYETRLLLGVKTVV